jgi:aryl-alcohol dehydrogenase-like predicted oxidoreductase
MQSRPLGEGPSVTRIGLGLAAVGRPGYINLGRDEDLGDDRGVEAMRRRSFEVLDAAWSAGVRYFDAARSYGRAEEFLAGWLAARDVAPAGAVVGSKWGYTYTAGWSVEAEQHEVKEHSREVLRRQWSETRGWLGPHLDLYQIHSATLESGVLENRAVLAELAGLRAEHGIRIGASFSGPRQAEAIRRAIAAEHEGVRVFDAVQATWNLLEPSAGEALREAHAAGRGVIVKEALANGRLAPRGLEADPAGRDLLDRQAARLGSTVDVVALGAVLAQPWADVVLSGAATAEQLRSNVAALDLSWDEEATATLASLAEPAERYWQTRGSLPWN